jgi:hypothetical protein
LRVRAIKSFLESRDRDILVGNVRFIEGCL